MSAQQGTVVNVDWETDIEDVGPIQVGPGESARGEMGGQACGACGTRITDLYESPGGKLVWVEVENESQEDHTSERCVRQQAAREAAQERVIGFMHDLTYRERDAWAKEPDSPEKRRAVARLEAEEGVLSEVFEGFERTVPIPGRSADFEAGVRWALHLMAYGRRHDGGWWDESWAPGYGADKPNLRSV